MATGLKGEGGEESGEQKGSQRGKKCLTAPPLCQMGVCCGSAFGRLAQSARAARELCSGQQEAGCMAAGLNTGEGLAGERGIRSKLLVLARRFGN